jgi:hypothetical protein
LMVGMQVTALAAGYTGAIVLHPGFIHLVTMDLYKLGALAENK